jgi:PAS domain S-box-containing protein
MGTSDILNRLRGSLAIALGSLALVAATAIGLSVAQRRTDSWVQNVRMVARLARALQARADTRNLTIQSYLLTADSRFLRPDSVAREALVASLDELRATVLIPEQRARLDGIARLLGRFDAEIAQIVAARPHESLESISARVAELDRNVAAPMREEFAAFLSTEDARYRVGIDRATLLRHVATGAVLVELLIVALVLTHLSRRSADQTLALAKQNEVLRNQANALHEQATELEHQTEQAQELTGELELTNDDLRSALEEAEQARATTSEALRERAEALSQLEAAIGSAPVGFAFYDRDLRYRRVNAALAALSGLSPEEHVGRRIRETLPALAPTVLPVLERVLATDAPVLDVEVKGATPTRSAPREFLASYYPIRRGGEPIGVGAVVLETTAMKELEAQFRQAQKMEAVGQLAGGIAHDFNNVLTAISSFSQLLLADLPDESPHRADVREIRSAADRAATLTRQLLAFSRKQLLQPVALDLNEVVEGLEEMLRRLLSEDVELLCRLAPDLDLANADRGQLEQIVMNLAVNARDAMPQGGRLTIETGNAEVDEAYAGRAGEMSAGRYVTLSVSDTGVGMDAATQARIFEPFFTTKPAGRGTGLGLSTVFGIVKQSGGHVTVYSEPGSGTTFRVYLPCDEGASAAFPHTLRAEATLPHGTETILLVEDDPAVRVVASRILTRQGYRVLEAPTPAAAEGIVAMHQGVIDLVLTDLVLPGMSGRELAELLHAVEPTLKVIYMSGYTDDAVIRRGLIERGMPFLAKPFSVEELLHRVRDTIDGVDRSSGEDRGLRLA